MIHLVGERPSKRRPPLPICFSRVSERRRSIGTRSLEILAGQSTLPSGSPAACLVHRVVRFGGQCPQLTLGYCLSISRYPLLRQVYKLPGFVGGVEMQALKSFFITPVFTAMADLCKIHSLPFPQCAISGLSPLVLHRAIRNIRDVSQPSPHFS